VAEEAVAEEAVAEEAVAEEAVAEEAVAEEAVLELSEEPEAEVELVEEEIELVDEEPADVNALLDEAAFYLQQNLHDDAERLCRQVLEADPGNSRASLLVQEIEAARQPGDEEEEGLDWDGALKEVLGDSLGTIDAEDADSHYNLGIAYKEMGLLDDAIKEFETAMAHPSRRISSLTLKALCLIETGDTTGAEEALRLGLACPDLTGEEKLNLLFEMGQLKETAGSDQEALDWFLKVAGEDHFYRDVGLRIRQLRSRLGLPDDGLDGTPGTRGQDKVSYL
ncbi:MAG: tetratricopeptide repeat protein, partial [Deltaproteobacteria bacterium]